jgi:hypothetical protein
MPGIDPTPVGEILVGGRVSGDDGLWVHGFSAAPPRTLLGRPRGTMDEVDQILDDLHGRGGPRGSRRSIMDGSLIYTVCF